MAPAWPIISRTRDWASNHHGVEVTRPQVFTQKDTQRGIKLQTTPKDGAEHGEFKADVILLIEVYIIKKRVTDNTPI